MLDLLGKIANRIEADRFDVQAYRDIVGVAKQIVMEETEAAVRCMKWLSAQFETVIPEAALTDVAMAREMMKLHKNCLLIAAPYDFESYLMYVEWAREPSKKFYMPRRKALRQIVEALQDLAD